MRTPLPSLISLCAFEAAARHRSFRRAAIELNITQGAISQQIKGLETLVGTALFIAKTIQSASPTRGANTCAPLASRSRS